MRFRAGHRRGARRAAAWACALAVAGAAGAAGLLVTTAPAAAASCAGVTAWEFTIPGYTEYFFVKTGAGWVISDARNGSDPLANVSVSVTATAFTAHAVYTSGDYKADYYGKFVRGRDVTGGHWTSNHDPTGGGFDLYPVGPTTTVPVSHLHKKCHGPSGSTAACQLIVTVKIFGHPRSGLAVYSRFMHDGPTKPGSKVFFIPPESAKCASGCMNVVVSVTDAKGDPVPDALVAIHASTVTGVDGEGYLCNQFGASANPDCGTSLSGLGTDAAGQVRLLYWTPGLVRDERVTFNGVTATKGTKKGTATPTGTDIKPYLIYAVSDGHITAEQAGELADWAAGRTISAALGKLLVPTSLASVILGPALGYWVGITQHAANAVAALERYEFAEPIPSTSSTSSTR